MGDGLPHAQFAEYLFIRPSDPDSAWAPRSASYGPSGFQDLHLNTSDVQQRLFPP